MGVNYRTLTFLFLEGDHSVQLVVNSMPVVIAAHNFMLPCCGTCNCSKGNTGLTFYVEGRPHLVPLLNYYFMADLFRVKSDWWENNAKGPWNRMVAEITENFTKSDPADIFEVDPDGIEKVLTYKKSNKPKSNKQQESSQKVVSEPSQEDVSTRSQDSEGHDKKSQKNRLRYKTDPEYAERRRQHSRTYRLRKKQHALACI